MLARLRSAIEKKGDISVYSNKNLLLLSDKIFEKTHIRLSKSTLTRLLQDKNDHLPTLHTLDVTSKFLGYSSWSEFSDNETGVMNYDLMQTISNVRYENIKTEKELKAAIHKFRHNQNVFDLLQVVVVKAIKYNFINLLAEIYDLPDVFTEEKDRMKHFFFAQFLTYQLQRYGIIDQLIPHYAASPKAQFYLIESHVDEDNLNGYYYDVMKAYHQHKKNPEAQLFYNCLMYQHAYMNQLPTDEWLKNIRDFKTEEDIHPIPKTRRLGILLATTDTKSEEYQLYLDEMIELFASLNSHDINFSSFKLLQLLFMHEDKQSMINVSPYTSKEMGFEFFIWTRIDYNQFMIYNAYCYYLLGQIEKAKAEIQAFDIDLIHNYSRNLVLSDYKKICNELKFCNKQ